VPKIEELDVVTLKRPVGPLPSGAKGTVVALWGEHRIVYTVEFTNPDHLIEVTIDDIELSDETTRKRIEDPSQ
jgi:hypothetical protein